MRFHHEEVLNNKNLTVSEKVHIVDIDLIRRTIFALHVLSLLFFLMTQTKVFHA